jgi:subtilisin
LGILINIRVLLIMQKLITFVMIVALLSSYAMAEGVMCPELEHVLQTVRGEKVSVIVTLKDEINVEGVRGNKAEMFSIMQSQAQANCSSVSSLCENMSASGQIEDVVMLSLGNAVAFTGSADAIREMAAQLDVQSIVLDAPQQLISPIVEADARTLWGLDHIKARAAQQKGIKGEGVTVAIVDTGIDTDHPAFFAGQVLVNKCKSYVSGEPTVEDGNGHGTHCAGTIGSPTYGVAPAASLIGVKVLSSGGSGTWSAVAQGTEYAGQVADVISMSLGGTASSSGNVVETTVKNVISAGTIVVIAAGNSGPWPRTIGTPGVTEEAITVGAISSNGVIASFSSRGPTVYGQEKPEIVAPGVNVLSSWKNGGTNTISGTSMATPHVAGLAALFLSKYPGASQATLKAKLMATAFGTQKANEYGSGTVDCVEATK